MVYIPFFIFHPLMTRVKLNLTILVFILRLPTKHTLDLISYLSSPVLTRHVICEGMHTTLMAQVIIFDIPSSLISLTRHAWYVLSWTKQRQTHSLFKKKKKEANSFLAEQWILIIPCSLGWRVIAGAFLWPRILLHYGVQWKFFMREGQVDQGFSLFSFLMFSVKYGGWGDFATM